MDTHSTTITGNVSTRSIQENIVLNKTAVAITTIIAGSLLLGFFKLVDAKYRQETDFSYDNNNADIHIHYCTCSTKNITG